MEGYRLRARLSSYFLDLDLELEFDLCAARESNFIDARVLCEHLTCHNELGLGSRTELRCSVSHHTCHISTRHDVDSTCWETNFFNKLCHTICCEGRLRSRLEHQRAASRKGRSELPSL